MSTTLTNGLKLPDKGSVDWYADMQNNYTILDGAVGTVAEHTSALAGKAPAVHTHTKSDVTDLFNSANTWSGENKYTSGFILSNISWSGVTPPSSTKPTVIEFKNSDTRQGRYINRISSTSSETWIETIRNVDANTSYNHTVVFQVDNSGNKSVYPYSNNDIDLGIAAHQWNNLYSKNYYYNGVSWGLDKDNVWSALNSYSKGIHILGDRNAYITPMWEGPSSGIAFLNSDATKTFVFGQYTTDANNRYIVDNTKGRIVIRTGERNNATVVELEPMASNAILGTSINKWKSFNGINPGALSLPDMSSGTGVSLSAGSNSYSPPSSGWLSINLTGAISVVCGNFCHSGTDMLSVPVVKGSTYTVTVATSGMAYLFVSQGNV